MCILLKAILGFSLLWFEMTSFAQDSIISSGGNASGGGSTISYSLGQIVYSAITGSNVSIVQGLQQPFEISVMTGVDEVNLISTLLSVYPNPSSDFIILRNEKYGEEDLIYQLYDISGNILLNRKTAGNETFISMQNYSPSTYLLKIVHGKRVVNIFKIIKH